MRWTHGTERLNQLADAFAAARKSHRRWDAFVEGLDDAQAIALIVRYVLWGSPRTKKPTIENVAQELDTIIALVLENCDEVTLGRDTETCEYEVTLSWQHFSGRATHAYQRCLGRTWHDCRAYTACLALLDMYSPTVDELDEAVAAEETAAWADEVGRRHPDWTIGRLRAVWPNGQVVFDTPAAFGPRVPFADPDTAPR